MHGMTSPRVSSGGVCLLTLHGSQHLPLSNAHRAECMFLGNVVLPQFEYYAHGVLPGFGVRR